MRYWIMLVIVAAMALAAATERLRHRAMAAASLAKAPGSAQRSCWKARKVPL